MYYTKRAAICNEFLKHLFAGKYKNIRAKNGADIFFKEREIKMNFYDDLENVMKHYSSTGAFLTVTDGELTNTMTVSWGNIGFMWGVPYWMVMVRPQRYTHGIISRAEDFTLSLPFGSMKNELSVCGTKSGKDTDKSKIVRFVPSVAAKSPAVEGCDIYYECRIIYKDAFKEANMDKIMAGKFYTGDFHSVYFGEIIKQYKK